MEKLATITKHLTFDAAHYLLRSDLSREENLAMFHKCCFYKTDGVDEAHGHTYHLEVYVTGFISNENGFIIDFKDLKRILEEGVVEKLDHRLINNIPYFDKEKRLATVENILHYVWDEIQPEIDSLRPNEAWLHKIKIYETPDSFATFDRTQWDKECLRAKSDFLRKGKRHMTKEDFEQMKKDMEAQYGDSST